MNSKTAFEVKLEEKLGQVPKHFIPSDPRFGSGPSLVPMDFLTKLLNEGPHFLGTSHRKPKVKNLVKSIQEGLLKYFQLDPNEYLVVLGNGGATLLFDMLPLGLVDKKAIHFTCGEFSEKWFLASKNVPWIETIQYSVPYGEGINGDLKDGADVIAVTLNETSTGVQLSQIPNVRSNPDVLLMVDATSGGGQCPIDVNQVDVFFFAPQKVFASDGGLFVAIMSKKARERAEKIYKNKNRYIPDIMNFKHAISNSEQNQTYNTPALATLFFMNEQIKAMNEFGGYQAVINESKRKAKLLYDWAEAKPYLRPYVQNSEFRSIAVCTIDVDDQYNVDELIKALEKKKYVYGIDGYRKLGRNQLRISLFQNISFDDLEKLTNLLSYLIE